MTGSIIQQIAQGPAQSPGRERLVGASAFRCTRSRGFVLGLLAVFALQGCMPYPHRDPLAPQISGIIRDGGRPMPGMILHYKYWMPAGYTECSGADAQTSTDASGNFFFKTPTKFRFFLSVGDPGYIYELCAAGEGGPILLWRNSEFARLSTPAELDCDMSAPLREVRTNKSRCTVKIPNEADILPNAN